VTPVATSAGSAVATAGTMMHARTPTNCSITEVRGVKGGRKGTWV
jgi:hypothetical protein